MFSDDDDLIQGLQISAPTKESIILEGVLKKKSPKGFIKAWQDRYIVLTRDGLFYYKAKDVKDVKLAQFQGAVPLRTIASIDSSPRKGFRFDITLEEQYGRVFSFTARSELDVQKWVMQTTLAWNDVKDADKASGILPTGQVPPGGAGGKMWRNPNAPVKNTKGDNKANQIITTRALISPEMQYFLNSYKPVYKQLNIKPQLPPGQTQAVQCEFSLQQVLSTLFSDFKVQTSEAQGVPLGAVYLIGNSHYQQTHRSYLLHCVGRDHPYVEQTVSCMQTIRDLRFPLFPQQIHCGETKDTIYSIYHPPLRTSVDTLFSWLQTVQRFPEHVVQWILIHIVITLQLLHSQNILFHALSPEYTFFDREGVLRICDLFLSQDRVLSTIAHNIPEYDPPEVVHAYKQYGPPPCQEVANANTKAGDFWRLGVFLYELSTGLPPFRATDVSADLHYDTVYSRINDYKSGTLIFPPFVSRPLQDLINQLLIPDPNKRLSSIDSILAHQFMIDVDPQLYDITYLLTQAAKPQWIYDNIIDSLDRDENTPINLTFLPDQPLLHRIHCRLLQARHITGAEYLSRLQFQINMDPDTYKTPPINLDGSAPSSLTSPSTNGRDSIGGGFNGSTINAKTLARLGTVADGLSTISIPIDMSFSFDFAHPTNTSYWPDLVIEAHAQKRDTIKDNTSTLPSISEKTALGKQNTLFGIATIPLTQVRAQETIDGWFTLYNISTMEPCGEIRLEIQIESEYLSLDSGVLSGLTDSTRLFAQCFGKLVPAPSKKLWSAIVDSSANPYDPPTTEDNNNTQQNLDLHNLTTNLSTHFQQSQQPPPSPMPSSPSSYSQQPPSSPLQTSKFPNPMGSYQQSSSSSSSQQQYHQPPSSPQLQSSSTRPTIPPVPPTLPDDNHSLPIPPPVPPLPPTAPQSSSSSTQHSSSFISPPQPPPVPSNSGSSPPIPPPIPTVPSDLPPEKVLTNWKQAVDKSTGAIYYYNKVTKEVSWVAPEGF